MRQTGEGRTNTMCSTTKRCSSLFRFDAFFRSTILLFIVVVHPSLGVTDNDLPSLDQVLRHVQEVYSKQCCFKASFDQLTVNTSMDLKDRFQGTMFVKKPASIALDVDAPEKQKVVMLGRSYTVFFQQDGTAVKGEVPAELNVEQFFGFFTNIGNLERNFSVQFPVKSIDKEEKLIFLELADKINPKNTYRILLGVDSERFTIRRAIIYDALGNYNRFDLTNITLLKSVPESVFHIGDARDQGVILPRVDTPQ
jgi:outer membrane lipoprotein-sorting protein